MSDQNGNHAFLGFGTNGGVPLIGPALPAYPVGVDALTQFFANMTDQNANHALLGFGANGVSQIGPTLPAYPVGVDPLPQFFTNLERRDREREHQIGARVVELEKQNKELAEQIAKSNNGANVPLGQAHRRIGELEQEMIENAKLVQKLGEEKECQTLVIEKLGSEKAEISKQVEAQNLKIEELEAANKKLGQDAQQQRDAHKMNLHEQSEKMQKIEADLQNQMKLSANQKTSIEAREAEIGQLKSQFAEKNKQMEKDLQNAQRQLIARQEALDSSERNAMDLKADLDQLKKNHQAIIRGFENNIIVLRQQLSNQGNTMAKMRAANENAEKTTTGKLRQAHINNFALQTSLSEATGKYDLLRGVVAEQKQDLDAVNREVNNLKAMCKAAEESDAQAKRGLQIQLGKVADLTEKLAETEAARENLQKKLDVFNSAKAAFDLAISQDVYNMEAELRRVKKEFSEYKESKNREFEEYKRMYTEVVDALKRENEQWKPERQVFLAERHLMQRQNEIRYKSANRRLAKVEKKCHEEINEALKRKLKKTEKIEKEFRDELNEILKRKLKKMQEIETVDLEEDEEDTGGVWKMLTRPLQYFFGGSKKGANQKPRIKRTMELDDEDDEPESKRRRTDGRKTPGLISVKRELAEMAIEDDQ